MLPHDAIVRLNRLNPSDNLNRRMRHQLEIILFNDFRGTVVSSGKIYSLVAFNFPRWLDCSVPSYAEYLLTLPFSLLAFIYPGYAGRSPVYYFADNYRYVHDGLLYIWVKNEALEIVSLEFCKTQLSDRGKL